MARTKKKTEPPVQDSFANVEIETLAANESKLMTFTYIGLNASFLALENGPVLLAKLAANRGTDIEKSKKKFEKEIKEWAGRINEIIDETNKKAEKDWSKTEVELDPVQVKKSRDGMKFLTAKMLDNLKNFRDGRAELLSEEEGFKTLGLEIPIEVLDRAEAFIQAWTRKMYDQSMGI